MKIWAVDISAWPEGQSSKDALRKWTTRFFNDDDEESTQKVMRYLRGVDRIRALAALLLPRLMFVEAHQQVAWRDLYFDRTPEGRPFLKPTPALPHPRDVNISHDGDWIVMAFDEDPESAAAARVGIDVMSLSLPHYETSVASFLETMQETMTAAEDAWVRSALSSSDSTLALHRLYDLWTYKEALTKNMGKGLGFDFKRIELRFWDDGEKNGSFLVLDGQQQPRDQYEFTRVDIGRGAAAKEATKESQIVVCRGPLDDCAKQRTQVMNPISRRDAESQEILTVWSMNELLERADKVVANINK